MSASTLTTEQQAALLQEREQLLKRCAELENARNAAAQERDEVSEERDKALQERDEYKKLYVTVREAYELAKIGILEQKAERLPKNDEQLTLAILAMALGSGDAVTAEETEDAVEESTRTIPEHTRKKPGRAPLPEHLPRITVELLPPEVEREGLDAFELIGTEEREVLERRPASHIVVRLVRKKFVRKSQPRDEDEEDSEGVEATPPEQDTTPAEPTVEAAPVPTVLIAELPELPIARGRAGPGLLAATIVYRWQDHLPLHRQQSLFAREGMALSKSTLCDWHMELAAQVGPLIEAMKADALAQPVLLTDATGVLVQAKERCRRGHFWVLVAPEKHVLFEFSQHHNGAAVDSLLSGFSGYLVADAHPVYDHLFGDGEVTEVACWAHCRRYLIKAMESDPERAKAALAPITALFRIERSIATALRKKKEKVRRSKSEPLVDKFFDWCRAEQDLVLDESPIDRAITYAVNQEQALRRFLTDGRLPLHNNVSERALRREAVGRKNWIFVASEDGAHANTTFVTLLASCQLHGIEPWSYLRDLFCLLPRWPASRVLELAPAYWEQTLEQAEAQERLSANVFRSALLNLDS